MKFSDGAIWNEPTQARSREKVERILNAALAYAVDSGSLDFKMTEIAKSAGVSVGTLYQFFPSSAALIAKLFAREMAPIDASMADLLKGDLRSDEFQTRVKSLMRRHLKLVRQRPGLSLIWSASKLHPDIEIADLENSKQNAVQLAEQMASSLPKGTPRQSIETAALLICHLWSSVIRLCVLSEKEQQDEIINQFVQMIVAQGKSLIATR